MQSRLRQAHLERRLTFLAHQVHHAAGRPAHDVGPLIILARARVAERSNRGVDEARIALGERVVAEANRVEMTERQRLDEEIRVRGELGDDRAAIGAREICGDRFFSSVKRDRIKASIRVRDVFEKWRDTPRRAALERLDFDHLGAEIGKDFAAQRALLITQIE